jgi:hypothetical protein
MRGSMAQLRLLSLHHCDARVCPRGICGLFGLWWEYRLEKPGVPLRVVDGADAELLAHLRACFSGLALTFSAAS